jgi:cyclopropane-fatty-acyl-phospholipid synthase
MSESSVRNILKLPTFSRAAQPQIARELLLRLLRNIRVGTLTLHDGDEVLPWAMMTAPEHPMRMLIFTTTELIGAFLRAGQ